MKTSIFRTFGISGMDAAVTKAIPKGLGGVLPQAKLLAKKSAWTLIFLAIIAFGAAACDDSSDPIEGEGVAPVITTTSLPGGTVGKAYSGTLAATGDTPIAWSKESGDLPTGLILATNGAITGTPSADNTFTFTVRATNAAGSVTKQLSIIIAPASSSVDFVAVINITGIPAAGSVETSLTLSGTVVPSNATNQAITWSVVSGPATVSGNTLTFSGTGDVVVKATIANGTAQGTPYTQDFEITVSGNDAALKSIAEVQAYLAAQPANDADTPVLLSLGFDLGNMQSATSNWQLLLGVLETAGKFVDLDLADCVISNGTITEFHPDDNVQAGKGRIVSITLPKAAASIKSGFSSSFPIFRYFTALKSFNSGTGVSSIPSFAFPKLTSLTMIELSEKVTEIGQYAFQDCTNLAQINLPAGSKLTTIGNSAFAGCKALVLTELPAGLTSIGNYAFEKCAALALTALPAELTNLGTYAFDGCTGLTQITLPANLTSIGTHAFIRCTNLVQVNLPAGSKLTTIGQYAFNGCTALARITTLPAGLTTISNDVFNGCTALALTELPSGLTTIGSNAFNNCPALALTALPSGLTTISNNAFSGCTGLTQITLPANLTTIGTNAFIRCSGLTEITLPAGVTKIDGQAFYNCTNLLSVTFGGTITEADFSTNTPFPGDLRAKYLAAEGGAGTYTRPTPNATSGTWTKE